MNIIGLQEDLEGRPDKDGVKKGGKGIPFTMFALSDEERRKRLLGKDYATLKAKYGWLYDQPINTSQEKEDQDMQEAKDAEKRAKEKKAKELEE